MGRLEEVLTAVDNARRVLGRNTSDLVNDPVGHLTKITDALRNTNAGVVPTATPTELTNRPLSPSERVEQTMGSLDFGGGLGVIKPKGGNWLSGQVEGVLKGLRKNPENIRVVAGPDGPARIEAAKLNATALNDWIDKKLTRYVKNEMASPSDPIRLMADKFPAEKAAKLAEAEAKVNALRQKQQAQAATRGVPEEYLTRTRQEVLAAEEARDLIAENQGLHIAGNVPEGHLNLVQGKRARFGQEPAGMAQTDLGKMWEARGDLTVFPREAGEFKLPTNLRTDPWLANQADNVPVYTTSSDLTDNMGFGHLTDELSNSLREGRISPEVLGKMNMEQAVRHVAEVNALRAVEASKARAMDMADMPLHKEYPTEGMSWRQLKLGDLPEGWEADGMDIFGPGGTQIQAGAIGDPRREQLQRWLKQEGDAMGHCVGGYCDDVVSGRSNIYSLRDAKGQPYVTIETAPNELVDWNLPPEVAKGFEEDMRKNPLPHGLDDEEELMQYHDRLQKYAQENFPQYTGATIKQVKGKGNAAPDAKYLPFVQDFIRSGKWSDIGDAKNTGLTPDEINQLLGRK